MLPCGIATPHTPNVMGNDKKRTNYQIMKYIGITILLLWTSLLFSQSKKDLYLGVLETKWPGNNYEIPKDSIRIKIQRVLFRFHDNKWYSLENDIGNTSLYPSQKKWYITFDGKIDLKVAKYIERQFIGRKSLKENELFRPPMMLIRRTMRGNPGEWKVDSCLLLKGRKYAVENHVIAIEIGKDLVTVFGEGLKK